MSQTNTQSIESLFLPTSSVLPNLDIQPLASLGQIRGTVWNDENANGTQTADEIRLPYWTVYLDQNQNGSFDSGETSTTTDAEGNYRFSNLAPGTYYVAQRVPEGWEQTYPASSNPNDAEIVAQILPNLTTTNSDVEIETYGEIAIAEDGELTTLTQQSGSLINLDAFQNDARFAGIDGSGYTTVIIDTGIDLDHPFFGPDRDNDGVADRIVYHYDFADNDADASDVNGHGSNVSSIVASSDGNRPGMAPGADIIHLKVFKDSGSGNFGYIEQALQWVVDNAATYNIASVNMSLGDTGNYNNAGSRYGIGDEISALANLDIAVVSAAGNDFYQFNSVQGVSYPAADPNSIAVGAVFDSNGGRVSYGGGAKAFSRVADALTPFSQRHETLTPIFAPGAPITGANRNGGTSTQHGTSQAAPHIAGISVLAQQLAEQELGRRLSVTELTNLFNETGVNINDGDDEDDNVTNTGEDFKRVDVLALGEAILNMAAPEPPDGAYGVTIGGSEIVNDIDFGNRSLNSNPTDNPDYLAGNTQNDNIRGGNGDDTLVGGDGADTLRGQNNDDIVNGGADNDRLYGNAGNDFVDGGADNDRLYGSDGDDTVLGGSGNDLLNGGSHNDDLYGEDGEDTLQGSKGNDYLDGGADNDLLVGHNDNDTLLGGIGHDTLQGGSGNDELDGELGDDRVLGQTGNDILAGNDGKDTVLGGSGDDIVFGGDDNDSLNGGSGSDMLIGVDPDASEPGVGELDTLVGGNDTNVDIFVLGDAIGVYYDDGVAGTGTGDYALIRQFDPNDGDTIELHGSADDYELGASPSGLPSGKAIFTSDGELIGLVQGGGNLSLDSSAFTFV